MNGIKLKNVWKFKGVAVYAPSSLPWGNKIVGGWVGRGALPYGASFKAGPKANSVLPGDLAPPLNPLVIFKRPPPSPPD